jgi:DDE superfamily endonuclease
MPPLPEAIILLLAPFAPCLSRRVWGHAQLLRLGALLTPGARTVAAALRVMELSGERYFTNDHRVLNRATWLALQASRMLLGLLVARLVPPGHPSADLGMGGHALVGRGHL